MRPRTSFSLAFCLTMSATTAFAEGQPQDNYFKTSGRREDSLSVVPRGGDAGSS